MGLCSYLLIGFYFWKESAAYAAKKAFLTTRVGDVFLMVGLLILYDIYGSLEFSVIFEDPSIGGTVDSDKLFWALIMLFIGAVGKSAQFPLHVWLPDAMEGPTPVSALIHAATMVNAGLYLVARMVPFVDIGGNGVAGLDDLGLIVAYIGGITAFMAASIAFVQNDIKKVLAYSTMSQLAYIFTGLGVSLWFYNHGKTDAATLVFGGQCSISSTMQWLRACSSWPADPLFMRYTTHMITCTRVTMGMTITTSIPKTCVTWGVWHLRCLSPRLRC